jgi:hypothetical protein
VTERGLARSATPPNKVRPVAGALSLGLGLPLLLALVLNQLRPDLIAPMLDHPFGYWLVFVERVLCLGATALYLVFMYGQPR